jgi:hypothetical protein
MLFDVRRSRALAGALAAGAPLVTLVGPIPAQASPDTLRRSIGNLLQAPLDLVLSPVVAGRTLVSNLRDVDDTMGVRVAYAVPGYFWLCGVQVGSAVLRGVAGGLELVPGIILLPLETDLDPLYDPADRGNALVELENPLGESDVWQYNPFVSFNVRFGVTYTSAEY